MFTLFAMADTYREELFRDLYKKTNEIVKAMPVFAEEYFLAKREKCSPRTLWQYAIDINRFFTWLQSSAGFKNISLHSLTAHDVLDKLDVNDIYEYISSLQTWILKNKNGEIILDKKGEPLIKEMSPAAKARKISSLNSFFSYYYKTKRINTNVMKFIDITPVPDKYVSALDKENVDQLFESIQDTNGMSGLELSKHNKTVLRDKAIIMLFLGTGIRVSELVGIDMEDINIYKYNQSAEKGSIIVTRKGGNDDEVFFNADVKQALQDYMNVCRPELLKSKDEPALFLSYLGTRINVRTVQVLIKKYKEKAGINIKCTPHALRRSYATNLYNESGDIYLVADSLGHSSVETTKKHYAKMSQEHKKLAALYSESLTAKTRH